MKSDSVYRVKWSVPGDHPEWGEQLVVSHDLIGAASTASEFVRARLRLAGREDWLDAEIDIRSVERVGGAIDSHAAWRLRREAEEAEGGAA